MIAGFRVEGNKLGSPKKKMEEEAPRLALLEEAIEDLIGKQENIGTGAKTDRDISLLKKLFFKGR